MVRKTTHNNFHATWAYTATPGFRHPTRISQPEKKEWGQQTHASRGASARQTSSGLTDGFKGKVGEAIGLVAE